MRRIKTYVMTVGATLCLAPVFNYTHAQSPNREASTQLLLQVQSMSQEIAQLRDMTERQQFQLKRLQRQFNEQSVRLDTLAQQGNISSDDQLLNADSLPTTQNLDVLQQSKPLYQEAPNTVIGEPVSSLSEAPAVFPEEPVAQIQVADTNDVVSTPSSVTPVNNDSLTVVEDTEQQAEPLGAVRVYPPVIDRSFDSAKPMVPITGEGAALNAVNGSREASKQQNQISQTPSSMPKGVIAVPAQASRLDVPPFKNSTTQTSEPVVQTLDQVVALPGQPVNVGEAQPAEIDQAVVSEEDYYAQGFELLKQSKYEEAASIFDQQLTTYPKGDLSDDAHYWIAEAMHVSRNLVVAKRHLKAIINDYPQSRRLPDAMLKTAYIEQSQGNQIEARILFQEIVNLHPQSDAAIAAKNQLTSVN